MNFNYPKNAGVNPNTWVQKQNIIVELDGAIIKQNIKMTGL